MILRTDPYIMRSMVADIAGPIAAAHGTDIQAIVARSLAIADEINRQLAERYGPMDFAELHMGKPLAETPAPAAVPEHTPATAEEVHATAAELAPEGEP